MYFSFFPLRKITKNTGLVIYRSSNRNNNTNISYIYIYIYIYIYTHTYKFYIHCGASFLRLFKVVYLRHCCGLYIAYYFIHPTKVFALRKCDFVMSYRFIHPPIALVSQITRNLNLYIMYIAIIRHKIIGLTYA